MQLLTLADLGPTKDPSDSVAYDGEGVIELTRRARIRERELLKAEAAAEGFRTVQQSAVELLQVVRDKFGCKDADALTLYLASFLAGVAEEWFKNPPPNGFVHASTFPGIGKLEINIRSIEGKTVAETITELEAERDELRGDLDGISELFPDSAPHKHPETGVSLHDDVRDALRDKQREYERAEANWRKLAAAGERERRLREALEAWQRFADHCHERNITVPLWAYKLSELAIYKTQAALAQPSEAARRDGERSDTERIDKLQSLGDSLDIVIDGDLVGERVAISWNAWSGRSLRDEIDAARAGGGE